MKLVVQEKGKDKIINVNFWSFFKCTLFAFIVIELVLFSIGFAAGLYLGI